MSNVISTSELFFILFIADGKVYIKSSDKGEVEAFSSKDEANEYLGLYKSRYEATDHFITAAELYYYLNPTILKSKWENIKASAIYPVPLIHLGCSSVEYGYLAIELSNKINEYISKDTMSMVDVFKDNYAYEDYLRDLQISEAVDE